METINQKTARLTQLLIKERSQTPDIMQRVAAHCYAHHGKKLTEYLGNGSAESEKHAFLDAVIQIVEQRQLDALQGTVPEGQTKSAPTAPTPKPEPVKHEVETEEDLPDPDEETETTHKPLIPTQPLTLTERLKMTPSSPAQTSTAQQALAAALAGLMQPKSKALTQEEVERIVDERVNAKLAEVFATIAQVLNKS